MRKIISLLILIFFFGVNNLFAEQDSWLGRIIVRKNQASFEQEKEITSQEIRESSSQTIAEALSKNDTHLVTPNSGRGENLFRLRGFDQKQVLIMYDGVPIYVPYDGTVDLGKFGIQGVERVAVDSGLSSILFGPNAMGGAVNIESKKPTKPLEFESWAEFGEFETWDSGISLNSKQKLGYIGLNAQGWDSNGFRLSDSFERLRNQGPGRRDNAYQRGGEANAVIGFNPTKNSEIALRYFYLNKKQGIPPSTISTKPKFWRWAGWEKENYTLMAQAQINENFKLKGNVFYDKYYNVLDSYTNDTYSVLAATYPHSAYDDYSVGFNFMPVIDLRKIGELDFSLTSKYDRHRSQDSEVDSWKVFSARTSSIGAEYNLSVTQRLKISAGLIYEYFDPDEANGGDKKPSIDILNPQLGFSFDLGANSSIFFKAGQRSRFPTLKDLYSDRLGDYRPNPDLQAEKAIHYEIGYKKLFLNESEISLNLFRSDVRDLIERGRDPLGVYTYQMQNLNKVIFQGVELDVKFNLSKRISLSPYYHYLYTKNISDDRTAPYLEYRPHYTTGVNIKLEPLKDFFAYWDVNYVSWQSFRDTNFTSTDVWSTLGGYAEVDLKLEKKFKPGASAWFRIDNLFDRNYEGEKGFPAAGRTYFFGFRIQLN